MADIMAVLQTLLQKQGNPDELRKSFEGTETRVGDMGAVNTNPLSEATLKEVLKIRKEQVRQAAESGVPLEDILKKSEEISNPQGNQFKLDEKGLKLLQQSVQAQPQQISPYDKLREIISPTLNQAFAGEPPSTNQQQVQQQIQEQPQTNQQQVQQQGPLGVLRKFIGAFGAYGSEAINPGVTKRMQEAEINKTLLTALSQDKTAFGLTKDEMKNKLGAYVAPQAFNLKKIALEAKVNPSIKEAYNFSDDDLDKILGTEDIATWINSADGMKIFTEKVIPAIGKQSFFDSGDTKRLRKFFKDNPETLKKILKGTGFQEGRSSVSDSAQKSTQAISEKLRKFKTPEEADASGLKAGTIVDVGGRRYQLL